MATRSGYRWRKARAAILAASDICWLCGHPGADTVDHVIELDRGGPELDPANLRPAHGKKNPVTGCPGNYGRGAAYGNRLRRPRTRLTW